MRNAQSTKEFDWCTFLASNPQIPWAREIACNLPCLRHAASLKRPSLLLVAGCAPPTHTRSRCSMVQGEDFCLLQLQRAPPARRVVHDDEGLPQGAWCHTTPACAVERPPAGQDEPVVAVHDSAMVPALRGMKRLHEDVDSEASDWRLSPSWCLSLDSALPSPLSDSPLDLFSSPVQMVAQDALYLDSLLSPMAVGDDWLFSHRPMTFAETPVHSPAMPVALEPSVPVASSVPAAPAAPAAPPAPVVPPSPVTSTVPAAPAVPISPTAPAPRASEPPSASPAAMDEDQQTPSPTLRPRASTRRPVSPACSRPAKRPRLATRSAAGRRHRCKECGRQFRGKAELDAHVRTHTREKPLTCAECGRGFAHITNLRTHERTHTGERRYECDHPGCGKAYVHLGSLKEHMRVHSGDQPYKCPIPSCGKAFAYVANYRRHKKQHEERCEL